MYRRVRIRREPYPHRLPHGFTSNHFFINATLVVVVVVVVFFSSVQKEKFWVDPLEKSCPLNQARGRLHASHAEVGTECMKKI